jgi:hypothetical protein
MRFLQDFEPLRPAEQRLLRDALAGSACWITVSRPKEASPDTEVRGDFVRFLALGGDDQNRVHESGLRLHGAYILGPVVLDGADHVRPLWLRDCTLSDRISFSDARTKVISLENSTVKGLRGYSAKVDGSLVLNNGFACESSIQLFGASIDGTLSLSDAVIRGRPYQTQRLAINLTTATIGGNLELSKKFTAEGIILLDDAEVGGLLDCSGGKFLASADPRKAGLSLGRDSGPRALKCHRLQVSGSIYLRDASFDGEISFSGAEIGGDLDCRGATLDGQGSASGVAMRFTRADVGGNVFLSDGFQAHGTVDFRGSRIAGNFDCEKGDFNYGKADDKSAMRLTRAEIGGNLTVGWGFKALGKVEANRARIGGNLDCRSGTFTSPPGQASTDLAAPRGEFSEDALSIVNANISGAILFAPANAREGSDAVFNGSIDLKSARAQALVDSEGSWPNGKGGRRVRGGLRDVIHLDGFEYERFAGNAPIDAERRKDWLYCQTDAHLGRDFKPQPFEQVVKVLKAMGHEDDAKRIAIAKQRLKIRQRLWNWRRPRGMAEALIVRLTSGALIGYGYRPQRALFLMLIVGLAFGAYFRIAAEQGMFAPRDPQMFLAPGFEKCRPAEGGNWTKCAGVPDVGLKFAEYPPFNPWIYSFDVLLPVFDLKQVAYWVPRENEVEIKTPLQALETIKVPAHATTWLILFETIFGWLGSLLVVAGFSGLVKTD